MFSRQILVRKLPGFFSDKRQRCLPGSDLYSKLCSRENRFETCPRCASTDKEASQVPLTATTSFAPPIGAKANERIDNALDQIATSNELKLLSLVYRAGREESKKILQEYVIQNTSFQRFLQGLKAKIEKYIIPSK